MSKNTFRYAMWRNPVYGTMYMVQYDAEDGQVCRAATVSDDWLESGEAFQHGTEHFINSLMPALAYSEGWLNEKFIQDELITGKYDIR